MSNSEQLAAAVDLGTNTFHLLVGRLSPAGIEEVARERIFVKVASDGIDTIGEAPFARAIDAAHVLGNTLRRFPGIPSVAFATAALRTASNGTQLRAALEAELGLAIQIIDGDREAGLIARGVLAAQLPPAPRYLIMDIGGGSVEFILIEAGEARYRESFPVGAQVLRQRYHLREPFGKTYHDAATGRIRDQVAELRASLQESLAPMLVACGAAPVQLIGSSGTFDVLADLYGQRLNDAVWTVSTHQTRQLFAEACAMTESERFADPRIPDDRADMIVVALGLIEYVLDTLPQTQIIACAYALKEGALLELLELS